MNRTQEEIVARMSADAATVHGNALLFTFLDRDHKKAILGRRIGERLPVSLEMGEVPDERKTLVEVCRSLRSHCDQEFMAASGYGFSVQYAESPGRDRAIRTDRERLRSLAWLLGEEDSLDWTLPPLALVEVVEAHWGLGKAEA